jgi:hypothetical protein
MSCSYNHQANALHISQATQFMLLEYSIGRTSSFSTQKCIDFSNERIEDLPGTTLPAPGTMFKCMYSIRAERTPYIFANGYT